MEKFKLTSKYQHSVHCRDGKRRNYMLYFLNGVQILKQKKPFDNRYDKGFDGCCYICDEYILNGKLYQTRYSNSDQPRKYYEAGLDVPRSVSYPISKKILKQFNIPEDLKIEIQNERT